MVSSVMIEVMVEGWKLGVCERLNMVSSVSK